MSYAVVKTGSRDRQALLAREKRRGQEYNGLQGPVYTQIPATQAAVHLIKVLVSF